MPHNVSFIFKSLEIFSEGNPHRGKEEFIEKLNFLQK